MLWVSTTNGRYTYEIDGKKTISTVFVSSEAASTFAPRLPIEFSTRLSVVRVYDEVTNNNCEIN